MRTLDISQREMDHLRSSVAGVGPIIGGIIIEITSSYSLAFLLGAALSTLGSIVSFIIRRPVTIKLLH